MSTTAREQFVNDYTLVMDDDRHGFKQVMTWSYEAGSVAALSDTLREEFEDYVAGLVQREESAGRETGALLVSQLLQGWGSDVFDDIARHYLDKVAEGVSA